MRQKESVTPSGVPFSVRNLTGFDQNTLSKQTGDPGTQFNKMLADCLTSLGTKSEAMVKVDDVEGLLSNDRKYILMVLRQHSLKYQKEFKFKYEWPVLARGSKKDKEVQECSFNFDHNNFPVIPYKWMRDKIEAIRAANEVIQAKIDNEEPLLESEVITDIPDGHLINFPKLYDSYDEMLSQNKTVKGTFPEDGKEYEFQLLDGRKEKVWAPVLSKDENLVINMMIEMRSPTVMLRGDGKEVKMKYESGSKSADIIDVEHIRKHIKEAEGSIDTTVVIQHDNDPTRRQRVDLVTLVDFFFPSQAL